MSDSSSLAERPAVLGTGLGVGTWVAGYLVTYGLTVTTLSGSNLGQLAELGINWQVVGWAFFGAHFVPVTAGSGPGGAINLIGTAGGAALVLYLVPVALLTGAGALAARLGDRGDLVTAVYDGSYVALGYCPPMILGTALFQTSFGPLTVGPSPVVGIVLAGVVYPVACGSFGGGLYHELS